MLTLTVLQYTPQIFLQEGNPELAGQRAWDNLRSVVRKMGTGLRHEEWEEKKDWDMTECEVTKLRKE